PYSLDYFALSSARALRFLDAHGGAPRARQLPLILRMLLGEALGFAAGGEELLALLASPFEGQHEAMKVFVDRGDRLFAEQRESFCRLVRADVEAHLGSAPPAALAGLDLFEAARDLAAAWGPAPAATRLRIAGSQAHMSANRLGLRNPEEVYLGRVLWLAARELRARDDAFRLKLW
ncbi:MAG: lantibiotic dehydratase C-terminal domain-containing protein, partial [Byssovorax sp.]